MMYRQVENMVRESFQNVYRPGYLDGITGEYAPPAGYFVDEADAFDQQFPYKGKKKLPGQIF